MILHSELPSLHVVYAIPKLYFPISFPSPLLHFHHCHGVTVSHLLIFRSVYTSSLDDIFLPHKTSDRLNRQTIRGNPRVALDSTEHERQLMWGWLEFAGLENDGQENAGSHQHGLTSRCLEYIL